MDTRKALSIVRDRRSITQTMKIGGTMNEEQAKDLIDQLRHTRSKTLRKAILSDYVKAKGEVPEEYKDAVKAMVK